MRIHLASFTSDREQNPVVAAFRRLATSGDLASHALTDDCEAADCILFVDAHLCPDPSLAPLMRSPLLNQYRQKALIYDERDEPWCVLPGVYVSMPAPFFDVKRQRAFSYYTSTAGTVSLASAEPDLLYSFIGSPGHPTSGGYRVRRALLKLNDPRGVVEDSSGFVFFDDRGDAAAHAARQLRFAGMMGRSKFVLCPRGRGTSSIRMYETLRAGRVPVVLADDWVVPVGPDWAACSITVREADAATLPALLSENEHCWPQMAAAARETYAQWFSPRVMLARLFDQCQSLMDDYVEPRPRWRDAGYRAMRRRSVLQTGRALAGRTLRAVGYR